MNTHEIIMLFKTGLTVNEIARRTGDDAHAILLFLTRQGYWSKYCSECVVRKCGDCRGFAELGRPISVQDQIDALAKLNRGAKSHAKE